MSGPGKRPPRPQRLAAYIMSVTEANEYVAEHHSHHPPVKAAKFAFGCVVKKTGRLCGVAIVGRPKARGYDPRKVLEVVRVCTDRTPNASSFLLARARKISVLMGAEEVVTYTLREERGKSLQAAGFRVDKQVPGRSWSGRTRPRDDKHPTGDKTRWTSKAEGPGSRQAKQSG